MVLACLCTTVLAQEQSGLARVDAQHCRIVDTQDGVQIDLGLSQGVPYRLYTLENPDRLVLDFREVDWTGLDRGALLSASKVRDVRYGGFRPGWSRMVLDLGAPMVLDRAEMKIDPASGASRLAVSMAAATRAAFSAASAPPDDPLWAPLATAPKVVPGAGRLVVVLDPGHGGIDPGAERAGQVEKTLMLAFARELRDALMRVNGVDVVLTRDDDSFVSLERRVAIAHQSGADLFISLHADALAEGHAHGATVHTLSEQASDEASALLAERHNRADMLAGVDLTGKDDVVADVLLDLARLETQPRTENFARSLVSALKDAGAPLNRRPYRSAAFSVLKAADIPSVLLEIGFLSSERDLRNLSDPAWRLAMANAIRDGIQAWTISDAASRGLVRQ